ncbi:MAG: cytidylate kinase family protein [Oscillospiraceae bacterium]|nr:cytidylate kinase family protein [Oscillospiraceae bacterium]
MLDASGKPKIIIAIGREFGSGGYEIGQKLAERLGITFYDKQLN